MGRKAKDSSSGSASMPIDDYRKKIGKQDWKKSKKEVREAKRQADMKNNSRGLTDMLLMLSAFVAVMGAVYFVLYLYLQKETTTEKEAV